MSYKPKFLAVLGLVVALAPFGANARSDRAPVRDPARVELVVGGPASGQMGSTAQSRASQGRAAQSSPQGGEFLMDISPQYAAVATQPEETGETGEN